MLTELVQNAIEHAFPDDREGMVSVRAPRERGELTVAIVGDGIGLPEDFTSERSDRLGLQIVRTLVSAEINGSVEFRPHDEAGGTDAVVMMPLGRRGRVGGWAGIGRSGQPRSGAGVAALERTALVFGQPAPHSGVLAGLESPGQTVLDNRAASADSLRLLDLQ